MKLKKSLLTFVGLLLLSVTALALNCQDMFTEILNSKDKLFEPLLNSTFSDYYSGMEKEFGFEVKYRGQYEVMLLIDDKVVPWADSILEKKPRFDISLTTIGGIVLKGNSDWLFNKGAHGGTVLQFHSPKHIPLHEISKCQVSVIRSPIKQGDYCPKIRLMIRRMSSLMR